MADKLPPYGTYYYNQKGQPRHCTNDADIVNAKKDGFTSARYVRSVWPTTAFNKKTGEGRTVGKLEWSDEQNLAAVKQLGDEWTLDYVATPDPTPKKDPDHKAAASLEELLAVIAANKNGDSDEKDERIADLETALLQSQTDHKTLEARLAALESLVK